MKHLYSLVFVLVTLTSFNLSTAQMIIPTNASAPGLCDGSVTFADAASYSTCTWTWYQDSTTVIGINAQTVSNLCAGNYLFVMDSAGVSMTAVFTISDPCSNLSLNLNSTNCTPGNCDGMIQSTVTGGSGPYTFSISGGSQTPQSLFSNLCIGTYSVTVVDMMGCSATAMATLTDPSQQSPISANLTFTNDSTGTCTGFASVSPTGGTAPYNVIQWSNGAIGNTAHNLCAGNYFVEIWDANGDTAMVYFTINSPCSNIVLTASVTDCTPGNCDGAIQANVAGGTAPYTFSVSGAPQTPISLFSNLCPGTYSISCMDAIGCSTAPLTVTVADTSQNPCSGFTGTFTSTPVSGPALCDGSITFNPNGVAPYTFTWDIATTTQTNTNLCAGSYTVTCVDANGCTITATGTVGDTLPNTNTISLNLNSADDLSGNCTGSASVSPTGGTAPYTVLWSNGQSGSSVSNLCAGMYSVTVWDSGSDSATVNFVIADSPTTYGNNPFPNGSINDTLYTDLVTNCIIDYTDIDSATLYQAVYDSINQNLYVTWAIYSPTDTIYINDTLGLAGAPGYYALTISVYCPNKSANEFFKIQSVIYFDGSAIWLTPTLGIDEKELLNELVIYPNPFSNTISVDNKDGAIKFLKLIDLNGRILSEMNTVNSGLVKLDHLETISSGTYLLILSGENTSKTLKVIK